MDEQKNLPLLNCEAAQILAGELDSSSEEAVSILAPYFDVGPKISDENLRAELPEGEPCQCSNVRICPKCLRQVAAQREANASAAKASRLDKGMLMFLVLSEYERSSMHFAYITKTIYHMNRMSRKNIICKNEENRKDKASGRS